MAPSLRKFQPASIATYSLTPLPPPPLFVLVSRSKLCIPYLRKSSNPHILNISPPLNLSPRWFSDHCGEYVVCTCTFSKTRESEKVKCIMILY